LENTIRIDTCEECKHFTLAHWGYYCILQRKCLDEMDSCPLEDAPEEPCESKPKSNKKS
jgi:hypothetical protein